MLVILQLLFILSLQASQSSFLNRQEGEISYLSTSGFLIGNVFYEADTSQLKLGDVLSVSAELKASPIQRNPGSFDYWHFLKGKGAKYYAKAKEVEVIGHHTHLNEWANQQIKKRINSTLAPIYQYILLGMKSEEVASFQDKAKSLAILHIFAISGMHFGILHNILLYGLSYLVDEKKANLLCLVLMGGYALILKGNVAAWRAYLMMLLKQLTPLNSMQCFGLIGCFFLWHNPQIIFNISFIYSMGIYFIVILTSALRFKNVYIFLASMLISGYFQFEVYPLGLVMGLLFGLVMTYLFPLFLIDVLLGGYLSGFNLLLYQGLKTLLDAVSEYSWTIIVGQASLLVVAVYYIGLVYMLYHYQFYHRKIVLGYLPLLCLSLWLYPKLNSYGKVVMLDVGQGDCFFIQFPFQKANILIDTGGLKYIDIATSTIIPFLKSQGVDSLDAVYISHQDYDHSGALESLQSNFNVDRVVTDFEVERYGDFALYQLNDYKSEDPNDSSQVIYTELGDMRFLFCGDISIETENYLMEKYPLLKVDVLKVAHHGSSSSTSSLFLNHIEPKVALVSVGKNNFYKHPHQEVLERLNAYGCQVLRTDTMGYQMLYFNSEKVWLVDKKVDEKTAEIKYNE